MERRRTPRWALLLAVVATVIAAPAVTGDAMAQQPRLALSATTTVGDEPVTAIALAAGQTAELHVDYAGFGPGAQRFTLVVRSTDPESPFLQSRTLTVDGPSGRLTVVLAELFDLTSVTTGTTVEVQVVAREFTVTETETAFETPLRPPEDSMTIRTVPSTVYLRDVPPTVRTDQPVRLAYYGWGRAPLLQGVGLFADPAELQPGEDALLATSEVAPDDDPFFEGAFEFPPERALEEVGPRFLIQARPLGDEVPGSNVETLALNQPPEAVIGYEPVPPRVGERVTFDAVDAFDPDGEIVSYRWDLDGDGAFETSGPVAERTFTSEGPQAVGLAVVDADGARTTAEVVVQVQPPTVVDGDPLLTPEVLALLLTSGGLGLLVGLMASGPLVAVGRAVQERLSRDDGNRPPTARVASLPATPMVNRPVLFDGSLSADPDPRDRVVAYRWTVGDVEHRTPRFVHVFGEAGEPEVQLQVWDTRGAMDAATETLTVESHAGELVLDRVRPDAPGNDHEHLDEEYLVFRNAGDAVLDLAGWTVHDAAQEEGRVRPDEHTYHFDDGVELPPGATVALHTGARPTEGSDWRDAPAERHVFWGRARAVWNNEGDVVVVEDAGGSPVLATRFERTGAGAYELEDLEENSLLCWFPDVSVSATAGGSNAGLSVDLRLGPLGRLRGFLAGAGFRRGPRGLVVSWGLATLGIVAAGVVGRATSVEAFLAPLEALPVTLLLLAVGLAWGAGRWLTTRVRG